MERLSSSHAYKQPASADVAATSTTTAIWATRPRHSCPPAVCTARNAAPWQREMIYERPEALVSEHHDFNATGWFDRSSQRGSEICIKGKMALEEQRVIMEIAGATYRRIQRKWEQQLRNDLLPR